MSFFTDAEAAWINAGGPSALAPVMAAIASAESTSGTKLYGDDSYSPSGTDPTSFGAWQIHTFDKAGPVNVQPNGQPYDQTQLVSNLDYNAQAAVNIWKSQGLGAWTTYTDGAFAPYLKANSSSTASGYGSDPSGSSTSSTTSGGSSTSTPMTGLFSTSGGTFTPVALSSGVSTLALLAAGAVVLLAIVGIARARANKPGDSSPAPG
jgi:hypothetical protein